MSAARAVAETFPEAPPPAPAMRRLVCHCGCGLWWYGPRTKGRPALYVNVEHYRRERNRRQRVTPPGRKESK